METNEKFFMLMEVDKDSQIAKYATVSESESEEITLQHDKSFIDYLERFIDQGICFYIDTHRKEIIERDL
ncbi:hypothetical protein DD607_05065 [Salmonella sp. 3DZ2-4SM]|uniref:Uncharacterized protein n=1 Tax=Mammaliicoccus sciuri TaxID=1296 RepID=A0AB37HT42_MAMSC|nr:MULTISPECIES: hypothetical protein [Staphylococcaceae]QRN92723.1 hypothetical protein JRU67_14980 [Mammaliicoccus sciuri]RXY94806.1 hypothetical protein DD607_05065 [Salmonella sp. 3DZ2-4SM]